VLLNLWARARKLHISDGLYGKALVTGIDAPPDPKVSHFLGKAAIVSGGSWAKINYLASERYTVREIERRVKVFLAAGVTLTNPE
jgi:hypothetical protein